MTEVQYRPAVGADLIELQQVDTRAWGDWFTQDGTHAWRLWIDHGIVRLATVDRKIIGFAVAFRSAAAEESSPVYLLHKVYVTEEFRNNGCGSRLIKDICAGIIGRHKTIGCEVYPKLLLTVKPNNHIARRVYRRLGFSNLFTEKDYYGPGEDRLFVLVSAEIPILRPDYIFR